MLWARLPKNRKFDIEFQYYNPEEENKKHRQIKFTRIKSKSMARKKSLIWLFVLVIFVIYLINLFSKLGK